MTLYKSIQNFALSLEESRELPHFHKSSFRVGKKIFATYDQNSQELMVKLTPVQQSVYCKLDPGAVYPVPGAWGTKGCTYFNIKKLPMNILKEVILIAYCSVAPSKLVLKYRK